MLDIRELLFSMLLSLGRFHFNCLIKVKGKYFKSLASYEVIDLDNQINKRNLKLQSRVVELDSQINYFFPYYYKLVYEK